MTVPASEIGLAPVVPRRALVPVRGVVAVPAMDTSAIVDSEAPIVMLIEGVEAVVAPTERVVVVRRIETTTQVVVRVVIAEIVVAIPRTHKPMEVNAGQINQTVGSVKIGRVKVDRPTVVHGSKELTTHG
jgi:hypothetical protein